jgi:hypothetical protein
MAIGSGVDRLTFEGSILKALRPGASGASDSLAVVPAPVAQPG